MIKTLAISAVLGLTAATAATAQVAYPGSEAFYDAWRARAFGPDYDALRAQTHHVAANGRCDGISYGTGAHRCGTATGGPAGGLGSRN